MGFSIESDRAESYTRNQRKQETRLGESGHPLPECGLYYNPNMSPKYVNGVMVGW